MATVAENKRKRGRTDIYTKHYGDAASIVKSSYENAYSDNIESKRGLNDAFYQLKATFLLMEHDNESFKHNYVTPKGNFKYVSVLIQIGRMLLQDGFSEEACIQTSNTALELIREGHSVHQVAQRIRNHRIMCKAEAIQNAKPETQRVLA